MAVQAREGGSKCSAIALWRMNYLRFRFLQCFRSAAIRRSVSDFGTVRMRFMMLSNLNGTSGVATGASVAGQAKGDAEAKSKIIVLSCQIRVRTRLGVRAVRCRRSALREAVPQSLSPDR